MQRAGWRVVMYVIFGILLKVQYLLYVQVWYKYFTYMYHVTLRTHMYVIVYELKLRVNYKPGTYTDVLLIIYVVITYIRLCTRTYGGEKW